MGTSLFEELSHPISGADIGGGVTR